MLVYNLLTKLCSQNMQIDPILQAKQLKAMTSDDIPYYESWKKDCIQNKKCLKVGPWDLGYGILQFCT